MDTNKDKTERLIDELLSSSSGVIDKDLDQQKESSSSLLTALLKRLSIAPEISAIAEEMRESILTEVNHRIDKSNKYFYYRRLASVAAVITLLMITTGYLSYKKGYDSIGCQTVEISNPLGTQSSIVLSDGTTVTLNAGSTVIYPAVFTGKNREVEIEGEAFFDVIENKDKPFIVKADRIRVQVLGTRFNVKAYNEEDNIEITLEEGSIGVGFDNQKKYITVEPGQQIFFDKTQDTFVRKRVNSNDYTGWKERKFYFNSVPFEDITRQLERRFNVHISIDSEELKQIVYTGDFVNQESLEQILRVITSDQRTSYTIEGDSVRIYNKKRP